MAAIGQDRFLSEPLRQAATCLGESFLRLSDGGRRGRIRGETRDRVFDELVLRSDVLDRIRMDKSYPEIVKRGARRLPSDGPIPRPGTSMKKAGPLFANLV